MELTDTHHREVVPYENVITKLRVVSAELVDTDLSMGMGMGGTPQLTRPAEHLTPRATAAVQSRRPAPTRIVSPPRRESTPPRRDSRPEVDTSGQPPAQRPRLQQEDRSQRRGSGFFGGLSGLWGRWTSSRSPFGS